MLIETKTHQMNNSCTEIELLHRIALTQTPLVGAILAKNLISYCGSAQAVYQTSSSALLKIPGIGEKIIKNIQDARLLKAAERELSFIINNDIQTLFYADKDYPGRLKHFNDAPVMLFYKGTANLNAVRTVAIVGTRKPTPRGVAACEELIEGLFSFKPLIISGLAYGIDITAHRKCLQLAIENIAVTGHGHATVYPASHKTTALKIIKNGGVLTEFTSHTKPGKENFPMRNRIIAGLADAIIVVETARTGGSMITAELGNFYNKDVFAIPGRLQDEKSAGCNLLIKSHRAALLESAADIAYVMRWEELDNKKNRQIPLFADLSIDEIKVVDLLREKESLSIDYIAFALKKNPSQMAGLMLQLEMKGIIKSMPGNQIILL